MHGIAPGAGTGIGLRTGSCRCGVGLRGALGRAAGVLHSGVVVAAVLAAIIGARDALLDRAVLERLAFGLTPDLVVAGGSAGVAGVAPAGLVGTLLGASGVCSMALGGVAILSGSVLGAAARGTASLQILTGPPIVRARVAVVSIGAVTITIIAAVVRRGGGSTCADARCSGDTRSSGRGPASVCVRVVAVVAVVAVVTGIVQATTVGCGALTGCLGRAISGGLRGRILGCSGVPACGLVAAGIGHRLLGGACGPVAVGGRTSGCSSSGAGGSATGRTGARAVPRVGLGGGFVARSVGIRSVRVEAIGLGETLIHSAAILFDGGTLLVRIGPTTLGGDLLLLRSLGLLLGVEPSTIGLELALLGLQIAFLNCLFLLLRLFTQLGGAPTILFLLLRLAALGRQRAQHDQNDQDDQDQHDDPDECG